MTPTEEFTVVAASTYRQGVRAANALGIARGRDAMIVTPDDLPRVMGLLPTRVVFTRPDLSTDWEWRLKWDRLEIELRMRAYRSGCSPEEFLT